MYKRQARTYIERGDEMRKDFDRRVNELLHSTEEAVTAVPRALLFRFLKRVSAHSSNVVSAVVMPVDQLDYYDESEDTRN